MFHEYALEPTALSSWASVRYFLDAFAPWKGRFIAAYPKDWKRRVYEGLRCPDIEKKSIEDRLSRLDRRYFADRKGAPFDPSKSWVDNALAENQREAFRAVIVADSIVRGGNVLNANLLDETNPLWLVEQGRFVARDPAALRDAIRLLLRLSTRIALIDPYFRPHQRDKASAFAALSSCVSAASQLEVHARLGVEGDPTHDWFKEKCEVHLPGLLDLGRTTTVHTWGQRPGGQRLHNRYLLTNIGGVKFGDSVERGQAGERDHISILDESSRAELWSQFIDPAGAFDRIGSPVAVTGSRRERA
ncbi:MAG: hypothetical protein QM831_21345 [Kofleriaceae bacterium]